MQINNAGLALLKEFEGCKLEAYRDVGGILTIGYGHTGPDVLEGQVITQEQADAMLVKDLALREKAADKYLKVQCTSNEFSAIVCFMYNVGIESFRQSTLLNCINKHNKAQAAGEFLRWNKVQGVVSAGLTRRREAEKALFLTPNETRPI